MDDEVKPDADLERIEKVAQVLGEHFDTVQIFATRHEPGAKDAGTYRFSAGCGNWYARYGQVREWMLMQDEMAREKARRRYNEDD